MRAPIAVPITGKIAVPTAAPATALAGTLTVTLLSGPVTLSGTPTTPSTRSTANSASMTRLNSLASPAALSEPDLTLMPLKSMTMPSAVFCVASRPVTVSRSVWPEWSLPMVRMALSRSKRSNVLLPIENGVCVCSDRARSAAVSPCADSVASPCALPDRSERRLNACSALATSTLRTCNLPLRPMRPLDRLASCSSPLAVPPPTLILVVQRSSWPSRVKPMSAAVAAPGRRICALRGRQAGSKFTSPSYKTATLVREIQVIFLKTKRFNGSSSRCRPRRAAS